MGNGCVRDVASRSMKALKDTGADKYSARYRVTEKHEINLENGAFTLYRKLFAPELTMSIINEERLGSVTVNHTEQSSVEAAAVLAMDLSHSSVKDSSNDMPEGNTLDREGTGLLPDMDLMYDRFDQLIKGLKKEFPLIAVEQMIMDHTVLTENYLNSNGADLCSRRGVYATGITSVAKKGDAASSFSHLYMQLSGLETPLLDMPGVRSFFSDVEKTLHPVSFEGKTLGTAILTPQCVFQFINFISAYLRDRWLISGSSPYKGKRGGRIAPENLSLRSEPLNPLMAGGYDITRDGYPAEDIDVIKGGILKNYILSLYGKNKTGLENVRNDGYAWVLDKGTDRLSDIIAATENGVIISRFAGGHPNENGDFSGVAKNSFIVRNGEVKEALKETMISGNLMDMMLGINAVSVERLNSGYSILPWISAGGITISGK